MGTASYRKAFVVVAKVAVSGTLLAYVLRKAGMGSITASVGEMAPAAFLLSCCIALLITFLTAVRLRLLLGGDHALRSIFSLCLIGSFFNNLLPGAVGGDAAKAYYLFRETNQAGNVLSSLFLDRYVGYAGLLSLGLGAGLLAFRELAAVGMQWALPLLFMAFLAGSLVVFGLRVGRRFAPLAHFYDHFLEVLRDRRTLARAYLLSLAVHLLSVLSVYTLSRGIGQRPPLGELFVFVPLIATFMALPVSIAGLGLREGAFVVLFGLLGVAPEKSASIAFLWYLSIAAASLPGLAEYVRYRKKR